MIFKNKFYKYKFRNYKRKIDKKKESNGIKKYIDE